MTSNVIGISCFFHDSAAALITDGNLVCAFEEERFSRIKHDNGFPTRSIAACLKFGGLTAGDIDAVVYFEDPNKKIGRILKQIRENPIRIYPNLRKILSSWNTDKLWIDRHVANCGIDAKKVYFTDHHYAHVGAAFFNSGFPSAAALTLDGVGEFDTGIIGSMSPGSAVVQHRTCFPTSLGLLYSAFTEFLGFEVNEGEYKVMGMSSYGSPKYVDKVEKLFVQRTRSHYELDMDYFSFHYSSRTNITQKFLALFGEPRKKEEPFFLASFAEELSSAKTTGAFDRDVLTRSEYYADVAASLQAVVQDQIVSMARYSVGQSKVGHLVYGGGVAYNCVANTQILRSESIDNMFIFPGCGDSGSAIGAAQIHVGGRSSKLHTPYLGMAYDTNTTRKLVIDSGFPWRFLPDPDEAAKLLALYLSEELVLGFHQGRFEFGPRALGNRSIIADPRSKAMKTRVNESVKYRELFRPFAPVTTREHAAVYFDLSDKELNCSIYEYMLGVTTVKEEWRARLGATTHANSTARAQIVNPGTNPMLHKLITAFGEITGVHVLLNTSFNRRGEPMVASPQDSLLTFSWSGLDVLYLDGFVLTKSKAVLERHS